MAITVPDIKGLTEKLSVRFGGNRKRSRTIGDLRLKRHLGDEWYPAKPLGPIEVQQFGTAICVLKSLDFLLIKS